MASLLRAVSLSDVAGMLAIYGPVVVETPISWEYEAPTAEEFESRVRNILAAGYPWIVLEDEIGEVAGYAYASDYRNRYGYRFCCESTIYIRADIRGRGWGKRLYETLLAILTRQGFVAVIGGLALPNPGSEALHRSVGFERVGVNEGIGYKFGEWHSVCFMQKELAPRSDPIGEKPLRFDDLLAAGALSDVITAVS